MPQTFVELYNYNDAWTALSQPERAEFMTTVQRSAATLDEWGVEVVAYGVNDPDTDRRAPYDFFCVYRVPDPQTCRRFEKAIEESGWYRYFDQVNVALPNLECKVAAVE